MIKGQATAEQFFTRSGSHSTKGSRKGYSLLGGGEDVVDQLTPEQKRNNIVTRLKWLRLMANTTGLTADEQQEKHFLDKECRKIEKEIKAKSPVDINRLFVDVCKELMPPDQFFKVFEMARAREVRLMSEKS